jgi:hypothetical protein
MVLPNSQPSFFTLIRFSALVLTVVFLFGSISFSHTQSSVVSNTAKFDEVKYLKTTDRKKAEEIDGNLLVNSQAGEVLFHFKGSELLRIEKKNVTNVLYERDSKPRYAAGLLIAWPLLFTKSKKHFLTIQSKNDSGQGEYAVFHLDKSNYKEILAAVEAATGVKVERSID